MSMLPDLPDLWLNDTTQSHHQRLAHSHQNDLWIHLQLQRLGKDHIEMGATGPPDPGALGNLTNWPIPNLGISALKTQEHRPESSDERGDSLILTNRKWVIKCKPMKSGLKSHKRLKHANKNGGSNLNSGVRSTEMVACKHEECTRCQWNVKFNHQNQSRYWANQKWACNQHVIELWLTLSAKQHI